MEHTDDAVVIEQLPNGMRLMLEPLPHVRSVTAGIWIKTGSANEAPEQAGLSHFLEHLFFKGTRTRTARQLMEAVESKGGHLNAFTSREYTCIYVKLLDSHVATGIEILADILKGSQFFELEKERNVILEEIASIDDVPEESVHDLFVSHLWPGSPLGQPITGTSESVSGLMLDDVRAYYERWYVPANIFVSVAGNIDPGAVQQQLRTEFGALPTRPEPERWARPAFGHGIALYDRPIAQHHLCMGFPGPSVNEESRYAYDILASILGGGSISRLFDQIREREGLAYSIYTFHSCFLTTGMFGVYAAVAPENLRPAADLAFAELRRMRDELVDEEELDMHREQLKGSMLMSLESTFNRMARMAKGLMYHGRIISVDEIVAAVDAVSAEDIRELCRGIFQPEQCMAVVLGPAAHVDLKEVPL